MKRSTTLWILGAFLLVALVAIGWFTIPWYQRTQNVEYGRRDGVPLTCDVIRPRKQNGIGLIFVASAGWVSNRREYPPWGFLTFLNRGYTVFVVGHVSQPKCHIPEISEDIHRLVRFIRYHATDWGIQPERLGMVGGSAGGHLALTIATQGRLGASDAEDPVDRKSSAIQAVGSFYAPTDFLNFGKPGEDAVGVGILEDFNGAFGPQNKTEEGRQELGWKISPLNFISKNLPPALLFHGDADPLVPIQQSKSFIERAAKFGCTTKLVIKPGAGHGWENILPDLAQLADWFDANLRPAPAAE